LELIEEKVEEAKLVDLSESKKDETATPNESPSEAKSQEVLFKVEDIKNSHPFVTWLQAATYIPAIKDLVFEPSVEEKVAKRKAILEKKDRELVENANLKRPSLEEICLLFNNLWNILVKTNVKNRSEAFINCMGFINSYRGLIPKNLYEESTAQRACLLLLHFLSILKKDFENSSTPQVSKLADQTTTPTENMIEVSDLSSTELSDGEKILEVLTFKQPFMKVELAETIETCSLDMNSTPIERTITSIFAVAILSSIDITIILHGQED